MKTDATGFAEVTYHDGSWMRVESEATLTIEDLVDTDDGQVVSSSIDTGEAWSRVKELSEPDDEFVVDTPVASATVRGTAFSIVCDGDTACTFSVVEGEVLVTPDVGDPVTLTAGQTLTVTADEEPVLAQPGVVVLSEDPFIAKNLELDQQDDGVLPPTQWPEEEAQALEGTYDLTTTITDGNVNNPVGQEREAEITLTTSCSEGACGIEGDSGLGTAVRSGDGLRFQVTSTEPCQEDSSITVTDLTDVSLTVDGDGLSGTSTQTVVDLAGCPSGIDPVQYAWTATRRP